MRRRAEMLIVASMRDDPAAVRPFPAAPGAAAAPLAAAAIQRIRLHASQNARMKLPHSEVEVGLELAGFAVGDHLELAGGLEKTTCVTIGIGDEG